MVDYIIRDIVSIFKFIPGGILLGIPIGVLCYFTQKKGKRNAKMSMIAFSIYLGIILAITFFSRDLGSADEIVDLDLFSTWHINTRNRAFLIENIILFIPYGFLYCMAFPKKWVFINACLAGFVTSLGIEIMQLVTKRGIFQLDDILTNIFGTIIGAVVALIFRAITKRFKG